MPKPRSSYRPDIDGLRALAVVSVIAFHLGIPHVSGGFIGVDVFFVISGYLITRVLTEDIDASTFSISRFYERRVRRIFPALFVMMVIVAVIAAGNLLPPDLKDFGSSMISAALSASNVYYWLQSGYFEPDSSTKLLLHTWSLGVEEQFYIFFPILLVVLRRRVKNYLPALMVIAASSLVVGVVSTSRAPSAAFYLLPSRAWELMLGSIFSLASFPTISARVRNVASLAGLSLILGANVLYSEHTSFPGIAAIAPCFGAAILIGAGGSGGSWVSRLLSRAPVVFVGKISYSLYLWHWPLIVIERVSGIRPEVARVMFFPVLIAVSILSWKYVEEPFRRGTLQWTRARLFAAATAAVGAGAAVGVIFVVSDGLPARFPLEVVKVASFLKYDPSVPYRAGTCFLSNLSDKLSPACLTQVPGRRNYLLLGDSHAAHLWIGLSSVFPEANFMQATAAGCKPVIDGVGAQDCTKMVNYIFQDYLPGTKVDAVVISAHWVDTDIPALARTVADLQTRGIRPIILGPIFEYNAPLPRLLANAIAHGHQEIEEWHFNLRQQSLDTRMSRIARDEWHVSYVSWFQEFCTAQRCPNYASPLIPMQFDYAHLTQGGSIMLVRQLREHHGLL